MYVHPTYCNIKKLHFDTQRAPVFRVILSTNTDKFPKQLYPIGIASGGEITELS
jgi:hypothetical protein